MNRPERRFLAEIHEQPAALESLLAPLPVRSHQLSVAPGQLFAAALSRAKGRDADQPAVPTRVTLAQ
jgi:hypothetical protein